MVFKQNFIISLHYPPRPLNVHDKVATIYLSRRFPAFFLTDNARWTRLHRRCLFSFVLKADFDGWIHHDSQRSQLGKYLTHFHSVVTTSPDSAMINTDRGLNREGMAQSCLLFVWWRIWRSSHFDFDWETILPGCIAAITPLQGVHGIVIDGLVWSLSEWYLLSLWIIYNIWGVMGRSNWALNASPCWRCFEMTTNEAVGYTALVKMFRNIWAVQSFQKYFFMIPTV